MNIDDLKDQLKESYEASRRQIEDSTAYILAKEKYDLLDPKFQKVILFGAIGLFSFFILSIPYSYYSSSSEQIESFEDNRKLVKDLIKVDRQLKSGPKAPKPIATGRLRSAVDNVLNSALLLPEQNAGINTTLPNISTRISKNFESNALKVNLKNLNLRQVADIGFNLQNIHDSVKMSNIEIIARDDDDHYFDVTYELSVFSIPVAPEPPPSSKKGKKRKNR